MTDRPDVPGDIGWSTGRLSLTLAVDPDDRTVRLAAIDVDGVTVVRAFDPAPVVEVGLVGEGRTWSARRYIDSVVGARLTYVRHWFADDPAGQLLGLELRDPVSGLRATVSFTHPTGTAGLRWHVELVNDGETPLVLTWVTTAMLAGVLGLTGARGAEVHWADNDWLAEGRWQRSAVRSVLPDFNRTVHDHDPRNVFSRTSFGAWSTVGSLPLGMISNPGSGKTVAWQIEHNAAWHWQIGDRGPDGLYLSVLGPTDVEHQCSTLLSPGHRFETVPATIAFSTSGVTTALGELTKLRRAGRRPSADHVDLPVIFNDYMNTLMGDPTTQKLLPLIDAAADVGSETFCIDAGWYDDGSGWWDSVGEWEPSTRRFPGGFHEVLDHIRGQGMTPGLWLEPEVVGVRSPVAQRLPEEAFFLRHGRRVVENGRYQLDFRHPETRKYLDSVVDRLVIDLGVGYVKLDYNINPGAGTDHQATSVGAGLLGHNRAYLAWLGGVLDRHPGLTIENCSSGGMRSDYAQLSRAHLQSTSDQQDPRLYPPIAAAAAAAIAPEQAACWAYPQPAFSDDEIVFTMVTALLGRVHLSGHLDQMSPPQRALVAQGVQAYKTHRHLIARSLPFWPLGLPSWDDGWVSHGLHDGREALVAVWRRHSDQQTISLSLDQLPAQGTWQIAYPAGSDAMVVPTAAGTGGCLDVTVPRHFQAVVLRLQP